MSLDRNSPTVDALGKLGAFGNPYHGPVQGGTLTLPNATTKTWPQPDATYFDTAGSTHLLMRPGQPVVTRTTEQAAADAADGLQWRNKAMLSGGKFQLYSKNLNGWVYIDPSGGRWLIEFVTPIDTIFLAFTTPISLSMRVTRFGSFGGSATTFTTTIGLTDWGQSGYTAFRDFPRDSPPVNVTSAEFFLETVTPSGSRAAISVHQLRTASDLTSDPTIDVSVRHPLGWLEISVAMVSGLPELTLSVLKNRAQTLIPIQNESTVVPFAEIVLPALIAGGATTTARTREAFQAIESRRLIAVWVDPLTEDWIWVGLHHQYELTAVSSYAGASGVTYTVQENSTAFEFVALEVDGVEKTRFEVTKVSSGSATAKYIGADPSVQIELQTQAGSSDLAVDGVVYTETGSAGSISTSAPGEPVGLGSSSPIVAVASTFMSASDLLAVAFQLQWRSRSRLSHALPNPNGIYFDLCRQSGQVLCQRMHVVSGTLNDFTYRPRVTPGGMSGAEVTQPYSATERFYGSWCPHTGAVLSMEAAPVCWV